MTDYDMKQKTTLYIFVYKTVSSYHLMYQVRKKKSKMNFQSLCAQRHICTNKPCWKNGGYIFFWAGNKYN